MTPGHLVDLIECGCISMKNIHYLILDEADCMLDAGFELRSTALFKVKIHLMSMTARLSRSVILSREIQILACDFLKDYIFLSLGCVGSTSKNITQKIEFVEDYDKHSILLDIIASKHNGELTLIVEFVEDYDKCSVLLDIIASECNGELTLVFVETKCMADIKAVQRVTHMDQ